MDDLYEITKKESRQGLIAELDIGDSVAISRRINLSFGVDPAAMSQHSNRLRGVLGQQAHRARRQFKERKFEIETGTFITAAGNLHVVSTITRTE